MAQHSVPAGHAHAGNVAHHFDTLEQQHSANVLGMWIFLATEIMLFGGLFTAYTVYRWLYPRVWAEMSMHQDIVMGTINTIVLLTSSLTMALAVRSAQTSNRSAQVTFLAATIVLGVAFLGIKGFEYYDHFAHGLVPGPYFVLETEGHHLPAVEYVRGEEPRLPSGAQPVTMDEVNLWWRQSQIFFFLYFMMTGIHALHMIIGIGVVGYILFRAWQGRYNSDNFTSVDMTGLYWHLVDIVWVFLFPLLYLIGRH